METALVVKFFFAFAFVISLMFLLQFIMKKMGLAGAAMVPGAKRRLRVIEHLPLDHRRKLVLIRRDDREHLLVLGPQGETVVEANIAAVDDKVIELVKEQKSAQV